MTAILEVKVHSVKEDGLPPGGEFGIPDEMVGRVGFIFDGVIASGYPVERDGVNSVWETSTDAFLGRVTGVTHWLEFPMAAWEIDGCHCSIPAPPYGYCPHCGSVGIQRERCPDGNDTCQQGHVYPSTASVETPGGTS